MTEVLKQPEFEPMPVEEQVVAIFAGVRGYLDAIPTSKINDFEHKMLDELRASGDGILDAVRNEKQLSPETENKLKTFLEGFVRKFA